METLGYVRDSTGDVESARYGKAGSAVPLFKRSGAGRVFGLDGVLRIANDSQTAGIEILPGGRKRARYTDFDGRAANPGKRLRAGKNDEYGEVGESFISVRHEWKCESGRSEMSQSLGHFFAGTDKTPGSLKKNIGASDEEMSSDEDDVTAEDEVKEKLKALDAVLRATPSDISSWLSLIALQEDLIIQPQHDDVDSKSKPTKRPSTDHQMTALAEVRLAVVEKAMRASPSNASSLPLIKARLELAASSGAWNRQKIDKEWKQAISATTDWRATADLWQAYLRWRLEDTDAVICSDIFKTYAEANKAFIAHYFQDNHMEGRAAKEAAMMDLLTSIVHMMLDAGFLERARGLLQAQIELSSHLLTLATEQTQEDFHLSCQDLEDYWDMQEYRIGEVGYKSWKQFREESSEPEKSAIYVNGKEITLTTSRQLPDGLGDTDPVIRWLSLEKARAALRNVSAKFKDEADWQTGELEVDPFSFVLYSDIRPFLCPIVSSKGIEDLVMLLLTGFGVCEMHNIRQLIYSDRFWPSHLANGMQGSHLQLINGQLMPSPRKSALNQPFQMPMKRWPKEMRLFYPSQSQTFPWFSAWDADFIQKEGIDFARRIVEQLETPSTALRLAHLGLLEVTQKHKVTSRLAKKLLNDDRDNAGIWRAYAMLERNNGNIETARTIYRNLVGANGAFRELLSVWTDWAELEWKQGFSEATLTILIKAVNANFNTVEQSKLAQSSAGSPTEILRARKALLANASQTGSTDAIYCAALFSYLSERQENAFTSAMQIFDEGMTKKQGEEVQELIAMSHCKFIWQHIHGRDRIFLPRYVTETLSRYVLLFPHNTAFVALLAAFEMKTKMENVLRNVLEKRMQLLGLDATENDWLVYIYCELHINSVSVNENAVRRLFERATSATSASGSSVLWQMYLRFEVQVTQRHDKVAKESRDRWEKEPEKYITMKENLKSDDKRSKAASMRAKAVLYRAIQKVPYCKAVYLTAFEPPLRHVFSNDELLQLSHFMQEKDVRFFTNLDAFLQPVDESDLDSSSNESLQ